ncbi:hypothetical protein ACFL1A_01635 [Patescibacteria group bacterium]
MLKEKLLTQVNQPLGTIGGEGLGPLGDLQIDRGSGAGGGVTALTRLTNIVSIVIGVMTVTAGIYFMFMILIGGWGWITSAGDKAKLEKARDRITNAFIGLVIVVAGWSILALVGQLLGWDIIIFSPATIIGSLQF